jgi:chromosome segregation ATPase
VKAIEVTIAKTQSSIQSAIKSYEQIRLDISSYLVTYNQAKAAADEASKIANQKEEIAARSKVVAENALEAYRTAAGGKRLMSTEKPFTVASSDEGAFIQSTVSASDLAKLKEIADQAAARYNADRKIADTARNQAEKLIATYQKIKANLEAKVAEGNALQSRIRKMQDSLSSTRDKLAQASEEKNSLAKKLRLVQVKATQTQNELTLAQVEAQKSKVIADKISLALKKHKSDVKNALTVAEANEIAVQAAQEASLDIEASSNSIDKIVSSKAADTAVKTLPTVLAFTSVVALAALASIYAVRRMRRRVNSTNEPAPLDPIDVEFDFDRILAEIRADKTIGKNTSGNRPSASQNKVTTRKAVAKKPKGR